MASSSSSSSSPMKSLPEDILIDILTRLPVKSILRFKSVSKRWSSLPTTPQFIAAHLRRSASRNPMLIVRHGRALGDLLISVLDSNFTTLHPSIPLPVATYDDRSPSIVGSSNGLLCLEYTTNGVAFWNPATKDFAWVPVLNLRFPFRHVTRFVSIAESCGFGFISSGEDNIDDDDDYKWVKFASFFYKVDWKSEDEAIWEGLDVKAAVFSWKSWSWKELKDARIPAASYGHPVAANGHLYWIGGGDGMEDFVLAFDLVADSFRTIDLPPPARPDGGGELLRFDMDTKIAVFKSYLDLTTEYEEDDLEVMVVGENGVDMRGETWDFMCQYGWFDGSSGGQEVIIDESCCCKGKGFWNVRVQVMRAHGRNMDNLYFFDPESKVIRRFDGLTGIVYGVGGFVHSLVPVCGQNYNVSVEL